MNGCVVLWPIDGQVGEVCLDGLVRISKASPVVRLARPRLGD